MVSRAAGAKCHMPLPPHVRVLRLAALPLRNGCSQPGTKCANKQGSIQLGYLHASCYQCQLLCHATYSCGAGQLTPNLC